MNPFIKSLAPALAVVAGALVASPALADAGGDPEHRGWALAHPVSERVVVPAASSTAEARAFHDKTAAEWQSYHRQQDRIGAANFGR